MKVECGLRACRDLATLSVLVASVWGMVLAPRNLEPCARSWKLGLAGARGLETLVPAGGSGQGLTQACQG